MSGKRMQRTYLAIVGVAAAAAVAGGVFATWAGTSTAAPAVAPQNVGEPVVTGTTRVGQVLRTTRGTWTGTDADHVRVPLVPVRRPGAADASDCRRISNAPNNTYVLREADAGFRIRSQVVATNVDGLRPCDVEPDGRRDLGAADQHAGAEHLRDRGGRQPVAGEPRRVGRRPADHLLVRLAALQRRRATTAARSRVRTTRTTRCATPIRVARSASASSPGTIVARRGDLESDGQSVGGDRARAAASTSASCRQPAIGSSSRRCSSRPNPVTSSTAPITARVQVTARGGRPVSGRTRVHARHASRRAGSDAGDAGRRLGDAHARPQRAVPEPRNGFNVQFFVKAFRSGDPALGGIAGYRLVQVRLAGGA